MRRSAPAADDMASRASGVGELVASTRVPRSSCATPATLRACAAVGMHDTQACARRTRTPRTETRADGVVGTSALERLCVRQHRPATARQQAACVAYSMFVGCLFRSAQRWARRGGHRAGGAAPWCPQKSATARATASRREALAAAARALRVRVLKHKLRAAPAATQTETRRVSAHSQAKEPLGPKNPSGKRTKATRHAPTPRATTHRRRSVTKSMRVPTTCMSALLSTSTRTPRGPSTTSSSLPGSSAYVIV
jgi:hypothetical protein